MAPSLTRSLLEGHLAPGGPRARSLPRGTETRLTFDHALMDAEAATLVFQSFEATGRSRVVGELALACA